MRVRPVEGVKDKEALFLSKQRKRMSPRMVELLVKKYIAVVLKNIAIIPKKLNLIFVKKSSPNIIPVEENSNPKIVKSISLFLIPKYVDKIPKPKNAITNINKKIDIGLIFKLLL